MTLRIAVAGILHETNTFAPGMTGLEHFKSESVNGLDAFLLRYGGTRTSMGGVIDAAMRHGVELTPGLYTAATPSGMVEAAAADVLINNVVDSIDSDISGLVLIMHGAMASEQYDDLEGECLRRLRAKLGDRLPIAMTIDLHGNVSKDMVRLADVIVGYDTYPHVDMHERAEEAFDLLVRYIREEIRPTRSYGHTGMLVVPQAMMTETGSMKTIMDRAFEIESDPQILNVTVAGGFPYSDVPDAGMSFIVTADNDQQLADRYAAELVQLAVDLKESFGLDHLSPDEAIAAALAESSGPVILVEGSDNVGGGAPADATHTLRQLVGIRERALIVIRDEQATSIAFELGVGSIFQGPVGGKSNPLHGEPVEVTGKIRLLFDGQYRHVGAYMTGQLAFMGRTAVVECGQLTIVLTEKRVAPWDLGHIRYAGLWPDDFKIIVVKSAIAWQTAFGAFAKSVIYVDTPGCCSANLEHFHYERVSKPIYPFDPEPQPRFM